MEAPPQGDIEMLLASGASLWWPESVAWAWHLLVKYINYHKTLNYNNCQGDHFHALNYTLKQNKTNRTCDMIEKCQSGQGGGMQSLVATLGPQCLDSGSQPHTGQDMFDICNKTTIKNLYGSYTSTIPYLFFHFPVFQACFLFSSCLLSWFLWRSWHQ